MYLQITRRRTCHLYCEMKLFILAWRCSFHSPQSLSPRAMFMKWLVIIYIVIYLYYYNFLFENVINHDFNLSSICCLWHPWEELARLLCNYVNVTLSKLPFWCHFDSTIPHVNLECVSTLKYYHRYTPWQ